MQVPQIDPRDLPSLIAQMKEMAPYYTPEWRFTPEDPDPGTALFLLFARMLGENIKRFNQVPHKNFVAFLNMLGVAQHTSRPAKTFLTFNLSEGAQETVLVPAGTKVAGTPPEGGDPIIYETQRPIVVTPALLTSLFNVSTRHDRIVPVTVTGVPGSADTLFSFEPGKNIQEHSLLLKHDDLFLVEHGARIDIELTHALKRFTEAASCESLANEKDVEWSYRSEGKWVRFDEVISYGNRVRLAKRTKGVWEEAELGGVTGRWLQCKVRSLAAETGAQKLAELELSGLRMRTDYLDVQGDGGIEPQRMYFNDVQIENEGCYPFGEVFAPFGTFYAACPEVFSKRGGRINVRFRLSLREHRPLPERPPHIDWKLIMKRSEVDKEEIPDKVAITRVVWEYWNGVAWVKLPVPRDAETLFHQPAEGEQTFSFDCPEDLAQTFVNAEWNHWIRARILTIDNLYSANALYMSPYVERLKLTYSYEGPVYRPELCLTRNNGELRDETQQLRGGYPFKPFHQLEGSRPAVYFGFDRTPVRGPISLYFSLLPQKVAEEDVPLIDWEYWQVSPGAQGWRPLKTGDETHGLTQSGTVQFYAPADMGESRLFGLGRCWIRAVNRDAKFDGEAARTPRPKVSRIDLNTVVAVQQETVTGETPQLAPPEDVLADETTAASLARTPVVTEQVWVDETEELSEEAIAELERSERGVDVLRDSEGHVMKCRVLYDPVASFLNSGPNDRHYMIDRSTGRIRFGDGIRGKRLPNSDVERVRVNYKTGGGKKGNLDRLLINQLQSSIAFVQGVTNKEPAVGGCDPESMQDALQRGPQLIRHRDRAVTAEDFEWLAREAYPNVSQVKCLPNRNVRMEKEVGCITLVVVPKTGIGEPHAFAELKKEIEAYMLKRAAASVAFPGKIQVIEPAYLEIGVQAVLAVKGMDDAVAVELLALDKINRFLNPLEGGFDGKGWTIGKPLHPSMFYALLKPISAIHHVQRLSITVTKLEDGQRVEVLPEKLGAFPHGLISGGAHRLTIEIV